MKYRIRFRHQRNTFTNEEGKEQIHPKGGTTLCYLETKDEADSGPWQPITVGHAVCSRFDCYVKARGRELSMRRAMANLSSPIQRSIFGPMFWGGEVPQRPDVIRRGGRSVDPSMIIIDDPLAPKDVLRATVL